MISILTTLSFLASAPPASEATAPDPAIPAPAQVVNPATKQGPPEPQAADDRLRSWELPPIDVSGERWSPYRESDLVGDYAQPRWTTRRLFPTTRIYVLPEGQIDFEFWTRVKVPKDEGKTTVETQYEFEFGLGNRLQLDIYAVTEKAGGEGELDSSEQKYELRYALADWGKIPWNPTLYAEWVSVSGAPDVFEAKLLLGDEVAPGWKVGTNLVWEHEVSGDLTNEYQITAGVSRTIVDEKFSLGAEVRAGLSDTTHDRGEFEEELEIGPSFQWRPTPAMHVDFAPLVGIGSDSRAADIFLVIGWEF
jgi:hypothetical protein